MPQERQRSVGGKKKRSDKRDALAGCYCSPPRSNVRSAERHRRGWEQVKMQQQLRDKIMWDVTVVESLQLCSKDVSTLIATGTAATT